MSQCDAILNHLRTYGSISWEQASNSYNVRSLTRRICDLRERGHKIISETKQHRVTGARYVRYHLVESVQARAAA